MDSSVGQRRKQVRADNTYLLALDGDVDFEPIALRLLVDMMKRNEKVGAVCGRIHPTGSSTFSKYKIFQGLIHSIYKNVLCFWT